MADAITKWSDFIITDKGLALRQKAIAKGLRPAFVYAEIGEGVPTDPSEIPLMTALVLPAQRAEVKRSHSKAATHYVDVRIDNKDYKSSVLMREIAVFAQLEKTEPEAPEDTELVSFQTPILYGYSYTLTGYESVPAGKDFHRIWTVGANVEISRSKEITIVYDGSAVYATYEDIEIIDQIAQEALIISQDALDVALGGAPNAIATHDKDPKAHHDLFTNLSNTIISDTEPDEPCEIWLKPMGGISIVEAIGCGNIIVNITGAHIGNEQPEDTQKIWLKPIDS